MAPNPRPLTILDYETSRDTILILRRDIKADEITMMQEELTKVNGWVEKFYAEVSFKK